MMVLTRLLSSLEKYEIFGSSDVKIKSITDDSRKVRTKSLFVAIRGLTFDGHDFISEAVKKGALVVVGEKEFDESKLKNVTYVRVPGSRRALGLLASAYYGFPSRKMKVVGVTGTDGKTTTVNLIYSIIKKAGKKVGLVSTISAKIGKKEVDTGFHVTNPEPLALQRFLAEMVKRKCELAVLEVTSHGLDQERVAGIDFEAAVLTNVTREHLDYHRTWDAYRKAKARLFEKVEIAILNKDDKSFPFFSNRLAMDTELYSYSLNGKGDFTAEDFKETNLGTEFILKAEKTRIDIKTRLLGRYNVSNSLAAVACARALGISWDKIKSGMASLKSLSGRLEQIKSGKSFEVYVDFAHTPNALKSVLELLRKKTSGKLIVVFGSAGERDAQKRPLMGEISVKLADISIFTAEDPRSEDVNKIIKQMVNGVKKTFSKEVKLERLHVLIHGDKGDHKTHFFLRIPERGEAIAFAIQKLAKKGDVVVVCGKGHEKSLCYAKTEYPWSDQEAVKVALRGGVKRVKRHEDN